MSTTAQYTSTAKVGIGVISTANTNRDGSGTIGTVFTAGSSGSRIDMIEVQATGTTTAGMVRLFVYDGSNARLIGEIPVVAVTPSGTQPAWAALMTSNPVGVVGNIPLPLVIPTGYSLRASTQNAETFNVIGFGGDF
jgi:hypothetical protein